MFTHLLQSLLVREDIIVNAPESKGGTALTFSAAQGHIMLVDMLLARDDIDVNHPKENGTTALFNACLRGQVGGEVHEILSNYEKTHL